MERIEMLREQAKILRNIAARSTQLYGIYAKLLALAHQCDELAETLAETLSTEGSPLGDARTKALNGPV
jgi:hypothetical protein